MVFFVRLPGRLDGFFTPVPPFFIQAIPQAIGRVATYAIFAALEEVDHAFDRVRTLVGIVVGFRLLVVVPVGAAEDQFRFETGLYARRFITLGPLLQGRGRHLDFEEILVFRDSFIAHALGTILDIFGLGQVLDAF